MSTSFSENYCLPTSHSGQIKCLRLSPDGELLASAASDGSIAVWNLKVHRRVVTHVFDVDVACLIWHESAVRKCSLLCALEDGSVGYLEFPIEPTHPVSVCFCTPNQSCF